MTAYYNEIDPFAAEWLRQLIKAGHIADGIVDERSIVDVRPEDLTEFTQCHFFAGIGGWSRALRLAGWPDSRPVWTGSPPCQPFSSAGKQRGIKDDRHLAPTWLYLIKASKPIEVLGEQVTDAIKKDDWLDTLQNSLEREGYSTGEIVLPACSVGASQLRKRLWFVAKRLGDSEREGLERYNRNVDDWSEPRRKQKKQAGPAGAAGVACGVADAESIGSRTGLCKDDQKCNGVELGNNIRNDFTSALYGSWRDADWLFCRDGKWRPVEPGTFPLVDGVPGRLGQGVTAGEHSEKNKEGRAEVTSKNRVGRLKGYGNAIVPEVAAEVIVAAMEIFEELTPTLHPNKNLASIK